MPIFCTTETTKTSHDNDINNPALFTDNAVGKVKGGSMETKGVGIEIYASASIELHATDEPPDGLAVTPLMRIAWKKI